MLWRRTLTSAQGSLSGKPWWCLCTCVQTDAKEVMRMGLGCRNKPDTARWWKRPSMSECCLYPSLPSPSKSDGEIACQSYPKRLGSYQIVWLQCLTGGMMVHRLSWGHIPQWYLFLIMSRLSKAQWAAFVSCCISVQLGCDRPWRYAEGKKIVKEQILGWRCFVSLSVRPSGNCLV